MSKEIHVTRTQCRVLQTDDTYVTIIHDGQVIQERIFPYIYDRFEQRIRYDEFIQQYLKQGYILIKQG